MRKPTIALSCVVLGALLGAAAGVFGPVVRPRLLLLPTDLHASTAFAGTVTQYVDGAGAALAAPVRMPMAVTREVSSAPGAGGTVVVSDVATATVAGQPAGTTRNQYTVDRKTGMSVASDTSWAYDPSQRVDRSQTYALGQPLGRPGAAFKMWGDEIGAAIDVVPTGDEAVKDGLLVRRWTGGYTARPLTAGTIAAMHLTPSMPFAAFAAQAKAAGMDLEGLFTGLAPVLSPAELAVLRTIRATPIPLAYAGTSSAELWIEPRTGAITDIAASSRTYTVEANTAAFTAALTSVVINHATDPRVAALLPGLGAPAPAPQRFYQVSYASTPAAAAATSQLVRDQMAGLQMLTRWVPIGLVVAAVLAELVGVLLLLRRRRSNGTGRHRGVPAAVDYAPVG